MLAACKKLISENYRKVATDHYEFQELSEISESYRKVTTDHYEVHE